MTFASANLINTIISPTTVFTNLKEKPKWFVAFAFIALVSVGIDYLTLPFAKQITYLTLSEKFDQERVSQALMSLEQAKFIGIALSPFPLLLRLLVTAAVLYFASILFYTQELEFNAVFSAVVYSELILLLARLVNVLLLHIKGIDSAQQITDLQVVVGLDFFLIDRSANLALFTFLNSINVFSIWYVATLTIGFSILAKINTLKSGLLVTSVWLAEIGFQVAVGVISSNVRLL